MKKIPLVTSCCTQDCA